LNFGSDRLGFFTLLFNNTSDDILGNWITFFQGEKLTDVVCSLWTKSTGNLLVGQTFNFSFSFLDDGQVEDREIVVDNAATDRFSFSLASATGFIAGVVFVQ
jgi:hypothetical protein